MSGQASTREITQPLMSADDARNRPTSQGVSRRMIHPDTHTDASPIVGLRCAIRLILLVVIVIVIAAGAAVILAAIAILAMSCIGL